MFKLNLNEEEILMKITVMKLVSNKDVAMNFIGNLITTAGGDVAYKAHLIITKDSIYLEHIGHASLGYAEETRRIDQILFRDLKEFSVSNKEDKELIKIITTKKEYNFFRDNSNGENLGKTMQNVLKDIK